MPPKKKRIEPPPFEISRTVHLQQRWHMCQKIGKAFYSSDLTFEFVLRLSTLMQNEKEFIKIINKINEAI